MPTQRRQAVKVWEPSREMTPSAFSPRFSKDIRAATPPNRYNLLCQNEWGWKGGGILKADKILCSVAAVHYHPSLRNPWLLPTCRAIGQLSPPLSLSFKPAFLHGDKDLVAAGTWKRGTSAYVCSWSRDKNVTSGLRSLVPLPSIRKCVRSQPTFPLTTPTTFCPFPHSMRPCHSFCYLQIPEAKYGSSSGMCLVLCGY